MGRPLDDGVHRSCHTRDIDEQETKGYTYQSMLTQVELAVNLVAGRERLFRLSFWKLTQT